MRKYFEVEVELTGSKLFHIELRNGFDETDALRYIAENYRCLDRDYNSKGDSVEVTVLAIHLKEDRNNA